VTAGITAGVTSGPAAVPRRPPYPPISDYGLIGAMHTCALVGRDGSIDWACLPDFDSPSVFGRILDWRRGGHYQVTVDDVVAVERRYLPRTNVLETTFTTPTGSARLTDFMPVHPPSRSRLTLDSGAGGDAHQVRHPRGGTTGGQPLLDEPFELRFEEKIVRILECVSGDVSFRMECMPRFDYGAVAPRVTLDRDDVRHGLAHGGANAMIVYCSAGMEAGNNGFAAHGHLDAGERVYAAVASLPHFTTDFSLNETWVDPDAINALLERTVGFWNAWSAGCPTTGRSPRRCCAAR
jgi:GH15 family glucan-1,4-alpha-glucosidase